jgi:hypothetical protein
MKTFFCLTLLLATTFLSNGHHAVSKKKPKAPNTKYEELQEIIKNINGSIDEANKDLHNGIRIKSATVTLKTVCTNTANGEFKVLAKAAEEIELENAIELTFEYEAPKPDTSKLNKKNDFKEKLTTPIAAAAKQWKQSGEIEGLKKSSFSVEMSFSISNETTAGFDFEVWGIGGTLTGKHKRSAEHTIKLTFE